MNINFTARQTNITPDLKQYCQRRLKSFRKFMGPLREVDVILTVEKYRHKAEIYIKGRRSSLNAVEETHDMYNSLNLAFDNLEKRVKKEKEKSRERKRRKSREREVLSVPPGIASEEKRIIQSQDYSLKPMSLEEAILQFEFNKRDVFVFRKSNEKWAVIYRRKDGNIGLVEPE